MSQTEFLQQVKENQNIIYKLALLYATDEEDKKDLYQEVLLQAWKGWPSFKGESKFSTWLYRVSLNTILTLKRKKPILDYNTSIESVAESTHTEHGYSVATEQLRWALRTLPETDRAIISLHLDGYENNEIAELMGISLNNTGVKLYRIKQQLAKILKKSHAN